MAEQSCSSSDRAWNDPPSYAYSNNQTGPPKRTLLNKRVPFPVSPSVTEKAPSFSGSLLPTNIVRLHENESKQEILQLPTSATSEVVLASEVPLKGNNTSAAFDKITSNANSKEEVMLSEEEMLSSVISTLERIVIKLEEHIEKRKIDDIKRRINILKDSWKEKLCPAVKEKMYILTEELSAGHYVKADYIHQGLIVDHVREVSQWMVGVKHIIYNVQQLEASSKVNEKSEDSNILQAPECFIPEHLSQD